MSDIFEQTFPTAKPPRKPLRTLGKMLKETWEIPGVVCPSNVTCWSDSRGHHPGARHSSGLWYWPGRKLTNGH